MSHHPTSAELAAFRYRLDAMDHPGWPCPGTAPHDAGAWPSERRDGIGYRIGPGWTPDPFEGRHTEARRGAAAMRSRMFAEASCRTDLPITMVFHPGLVQTSDLGLARPGDRWFVGAWTEEVELGCPSWPKR